MKTGFIAAGLIALCLAPPALAQTNPVDPTMAPPQPSTDSAPASSQGGPTNQQTAQLVLTLADVLSRVAAQRQNNSGEPLARTLAQSPALQQLAQTLLATRLGNAGIAQSNNLALALSSVLGQAASKKQVSAADLAAMLAPLLNRQLPGVEGSPGAGGDTAAPQTEAIAAALAELLNQAAARGQNPLARNASAPWPGPNNVERFSGRFVGENLTIDSTANQGQYSGVFKLGQSTFRFFAVETNSELAGVFESKDGQFDFKAALDGDSLSLVTGDTTYRLTRQQRSNPLARASGAAGYPVDSEAPANPMTIAQLPGAPRWQNVYRHETGASFHYPDGWQIREDANLGAVFLLPDDAPGAGRETILVSGADGGGVTSVSDPRVLQGIEALVLQNNPSMRRTGRAEPAKAGGHPGLVFTWDAPGSSRIRVFTTLLSRYVVSLTIIGPNERVTARETVLRQIFDTFDIRAVAPGGAPGMATAGDSGTSGSGLDNRLIGNWVKMDYRKVLGSSITRYSHAVLRADGTAIINTSGESIHPGAAGQSSGSTPARWRAGGGRFTFVTSGGTEDYTYDIQFNNNWPTLRLHPLGGGALQEWTKE